MESFVNATRIAASLGVLTAFGVAAKFFWDRYRWRRFHFAVRNWLLYTSVSDVSEVEHPKLMTEYQWAALAERMLFTAFFSPFESERLLPLAVATAKSFVRSQFI